MDLLEDSRAVANKRRCQSIESPGSHKKQRFLAGRKDDDILLVFPFCAENDLIEKAASGLKEVRGNPLDCTEGLRITDSAVAVAVQDGGKACGKDSVKEDGLRAEGPGRLGRSHVLTVRVGDYKLLEPGKWLNDTLVDFWMRWQVFSATH